MTSLADIDRRLRRSQISAAQIIHAGRTIIEVGDVSRPIDVHSMRKSIVSVLIGQAYDRRDIDLSTTLCELDIDDTPPLSGLEKSATIDDLLTARSGREDRTRPGRSGVTTTGISMCWDISTSGSPAAACSSHSTTIWPGRWA